MKLRKKKNKKKGKMQILIVAKQNQSGLKTAKRVEQHLSRKHIELYFDRSTALRLRKRKSTSVKKFEGDLIITLGGDGTFLWTAYQANVPIMPVKIEGAGFLCTTNYKDFIKSIDKILKYEYKVTQRMRLKCTKLKHGLLAKFLPSEYPLSINEIVFARKRPSKILQLRAIVNGVPFDMKGDGLIISTSYGSTAYALSAGGTIIDPAIEAMHIVPLAAFHSKIKPMIVPADQKIEIEVLSGDCAVIIDGHTGDYVKSGSKFVIEKGAPAKVATLKDINFYERFKRTFFEGDFIVLK